MARQGGNPQLTKILTDEGVAFAVHQFDTSDSVDAEIGLPTAAFDAPERVFRTCLFLDGDAVIAAVFPTDRLLDEVELAASVGAAELSPAGDSAIQKLSGLAANTLTPIGLAADTIVDITALDFETVFVSSGVAGSVVELSTADLLATTHARTAPISRRL